MRDRAPEDRTSGVPAPTRAGGPQGPADPPRLSAAPLSVSSATTLSARARERANSHGVVPHLALLACIVVWSANAVVLKVGLEHVRPIPFTAARFLIAGVVLLALGTAGARKVLKLPRASLLVPAALLGIVLNQLAFTEGLHLTTAVDVSLIMGLSPLLTALVLVMWQRTAVPRLQWLALGIGLAGTVAVVAAGAGRGSGGSLAGDLIVMGAPASWAIYLVMINRIGDQAQVRALPPWSMLLGAAILLPAALLFAGPGRDDWLPALLPLAYSSLLASALTWTLYFWALPRVGVTGTAIYTYLQPPLGAFFGAVFLHEPFGAAQLFGAALILLAAYLGTWRLAFRRAPAS